LLSVGSAAANTGDSNNNAAARFARAANGSKLEGSFLVMDAVTAMSAVSSVGPPAAPCLPNIAIALPLF
jgi:hypothetical protein